MLNIGGLPIIEYAQQDGMKHILGAARTGRGVGNITANYQTINGQQWCTSLTIEFVVPEPTENINV